MKFLEVVGCAWPKDQSIRFWRRSDNPSPTLPHFFTPVTDFQWENNTLAVFARWQHYNERGIKHAAQRGWCLFVEAIPVLDDLSYTKCILMKCSQQLQCNFPINSKGSLNIYIYDILLHNAKICQWYLLLTHVCILSTFGNMSKHSILFYVVTYLQKHLMNKTLNCIFNWRPKTKIQEYVCDRK